MLFCNKSLNNKVEILHSFINRKYLEILTVIICLTLFGVLINTKYTITSPNFETDIKIQSQEIEFKKFQRKLDFKVKMQKILKCEDKILKMELTQHGDYWLFRNYIRGRYSTQIGCGESITYTTHGDYTYMYNIPILVKRWLAPISFAAYAPGDDYNATMYSIYYLRNCLPESQLIRDYVTFHIYFPLQHNPSSMAKTEEEIEKWSYNCNEPFAPYDNVNRKLMYRPELGYPINTGRNIARKSANTHFVMDCDIKLYPSYDLVQKFLNMIKENPKVIANSKTVFPLAIFEVDQNVAIPNTKKELVEMLKNHTAIAFHATNDQHLYTVPQQKQWLKTKDTNKLRIFNTNKRLGKYSLWKPIYISNNNEPLDDERFFWKSKSYRVIQNYAMCAMDYNYSLLYPAFLVQLSDFKKQSKKSEKLQITKDKTLIKVYQEYKILYGQSRHCEL